MKILLDENTSADLKALLTSHEVVHVRECGWKGLKNGRLLAEAELAGFAVLITADKQMRFQQNIAALKLSLLVFDIHPVSAERQLACAPSILELLPNLEPGSVYLLKA